MTRLSSDWRYKDENFQQRAYLLTSLVRNNIQLTSSAYQFCDHVIKKGWSPIFDDHECDRQIKELYTNFISEKNDNN